MFRALIGGRLEDYEIKSYYPYGGTKVFFDKAEMSTIKSLGDSGSVCLSALSLDSLHNSRISL